MKHPTLIPIYAHLLCNEDLSEVTEDVAQHLFQRTVDAGLLRHDEGDEGPELCSEPTMMRLLKASAATADVELRRLADRLEALLLQEFQARLLRH
jgi:hypothetical protein